MYIDITATPFQSVLFPHLATGSIFSSCFDDPILTHKARRTRTTTLIYLFINKSIPISVVYAIGKEAKGKILANKVWFSFLTEHFAILEPQNSSIQKTHEVEKYRLNSFLARKSGNVRSGCFHFPTR